jgi:MazG family protein
MERLIEIMAKLRDPESGCPWDVEQYFRSVAPYTIEEAYEVAEAIDRGDFEALRDELGDLLLQVVFHAQMAREAGRFNIGDVVASICDKLVRRHPHVFGDAVVADADAQTHAWEDHKARERRAAGGAAGALAGVALGLPALLRAAKLQRRASRAGFAWEGAGQIFAKLREEVDEVERELERGQRERAIDELGDILFVTAGLVRELGGDPEDTLRLTNTRFVHRFEAMEAELAAASRGFAELSSDEQWARWRRAKEAVSSDESRAR